MEMVSWPPWKQYCMEVSSDMEKQKEKCDKMVVDQAI